MRTIESSGKAAERRAYATNSTLAGVNLLSGGWGASGTEAMRHAGTARAVGNNKPGSWSDGWGGSGVGAMPYAPPAGAAKSRAA